eukprot:323762_1
MSTPTTTTKSGTSQLSINKPKSKSKSRHRKRRNSNNSVASIVSIDPVSLKNLRAFQAKVAQENKKQKALYMQQKKSQFEDFSKKYIATELKEDDDDESFSKSHSDFDTTKPSKSSKMYHHHDIYEPSSSKGTPTSIDPNQAMEDITVEELLPLIKNLVDRHNKLQQEYDNLNREFREQRIVFEDKISELEQDISFEEMNQYNETNMTRSSGKRSRGSATGHDAANLKHLRQEYEDKIEHLKNNYQSNLLSMQSQYETEIETQKKEIHNLTKDLNDADKENDALRQTLEALEHENQSLRISINNNNKQFQNSKLYQNKNKSLLLENETLKQQIEALEHEMDCIMQEQEQQEVDMDNNNYLNQNNMGTKANPNQRPQTPTHAYTRTMVMGTRDALDVGSNKGLSDGRDSSVGGDDLMQQIGDELMMTNRSSVDPPMMDRDSNYGDDADQYEDDEKKMNDDSRSHGSRNTLANLSKFKKIGAMDPDSMAAIMALLEQKEKKRLQSSHGLNSSKDVVDNCSVESNYSDSQQNLEEQIGTIEDDIRELKDMVLSLMDSTNNIQPSINSNLGPLIRKINRMYVMLSGPMESRTAMSQMDDNASDYGNRYDPPISERSYNTSMDHHGQQSEKSWIALVTPYVNEWMPSIGFSAIILSTMYLLM